MHAAATILALLPAATLAWDPKLCNGAGGCQGLTWISEFGYSCPSGASIGPQPFAQALTDIAQGGYEYVASDEFPASCMRAGDVPGSADTTQLVKHVAGDSGITLYGYITDSCTETEVAVPGDCYNANPNPSPFTTCRVTEKDITTFCSEDESLHL
ncbi:hypothetical protein Daus18300_008453 [Diaporthe australafricana]|uniref:Uncharacterized protein n=1 Tax=Diaporthe australafricana TaxID=127596 RepID=A0ABR3WIH9_9PEZI